MARRIDLLEAIDFLGESDPVMRDWFREHGIPVLEVEEDSYFSLIGMIMGQQLSSKAADTIFRRFIAKAGDELTPERVLALEDEEMRTVGLSRQKIAYIKDLSHHFQESPHIYNDLHSMEVEVVYEHLIKIKGIGPWTIEMFEMFTLGRLDVFSPGDLGLKNALIEFYGLAPNHPASERIAFAKRWAPYRSVASLMLWKALGT
jgi:DNA-3-methyladenine glycosylase II